jgi:proline iminopeptidase
MHLDDILYPPIEPFESGMLEVEAPHQIYWERSGNPQGKPVIVIHGGPGGGSQPEYRSYFNPLKYCIVQFDQRACGKSTPHAKLESNHTMASVEDIETLRTHFGIEKWQVFGGSWGSTLSLIYAQTHPERVNELVLRGIFLCRSKELQWFYQHGASEMFPDAFAPYREHIPKDEQHDLISAYYKRLTSDDETTRIEAAKQWTGWEMATSKLIPDADYLKKADDAHFALAFARIECHYFINHIFLEENVILNNIEKIQDIPGIIVQGRYDVVCPPVSAWDLHQAWSKSELLMIADAGHSVGEFGIAQALVAATDRFAS